MLGCTGEIANSPVPEESPLAEPAKSSPSPETAPSPSAKAPASYDGHHTNEGKIEEGTSAKEGATCEVSATPDYSDRISIGQYAEDFLRQQIHELDYYAEHISSQSNGKAFLIAESNGTLHEIFYDGEYRRYYMVYVGEQWESHRVNWDWFYVCENYNQVLWYNLLDDDVYSLSEWRSRFVRYLPVP
jgi:hypothetical protein